MKVFVISGIQPNKKQPFGGAFISKRVDLLNKIISCDLYKITNYYSNFYKYIYSNILNRKIIDEDKDIISNGVTWNNILIKKGLISTLLFKTSEKIFYKQKIIEIEKLINIESYDVIHAHWAYPTGYIAMLLSHKYKIPYVVTCHGSDIHTIAARNEKICKYTLEVLENASKIIFVSENLKAVAMGLGYSGENACVIYNGVDLQKFKIINSISNKEKIGETKRIIGFIGRLENIKGADRIPKIFEEINRIYTNTKFHIIGDGELKNNIIKQLNDSNLEFIHTPSMAYGDLGRHINELDVVIVPSRNESFCCIALEVQACGGKVVASNVGGIPECMGSYGFLVDNGDNFEERFAEVVVKALNSDIDTEAMINRVQEFSWENTVQMECDIYAELIMKGKNNEQ